MPDPAPITWKLSPTLVKKLPDSEQSTASQVLWSKNGGTCALCGEPLPSDGKGITADHEMAQAEGDGGADTIANLYLAHSRCNSSRKNLQFGVARKLIRFAKWCEAVPGRNFTDVTKKYIGNSPKIATYSREGQEISVAFGSDIRVASVSVDPATGTEYFFMNVPVGYVFNDDETQPRVIEPDHVRTLATDFLAHPVHEPSNCRFITVDDDKARLLQFDGQHKTTAQIVLSRTEVPMKLYMNPDEPMIQELVVQIQQGIKKRPLSTTDTLKKLDDVIRDKVSEYEAKHKSKPSESTLVAAQPKQDTSAFKKRLLGNLDHIVLQDENFSMREFASSKANKTLPFTDTVLVKKMIKPLLSQELVEHEPIQTGAERERELGMVVHLLNRICETMLVDRWDTDLDDDVATRRARNFFYQGAIGYWMGELLIPTIKLNMPASTRGKLLRNQLSDADLERIETAIDVICGWEIWSTTDKDDLDALRSNTVANVSAAFPGHTHYKLMQDVNARLDQ